MMSGSPFSLHGESAYQKWRQKKLEQLFSSSKDLYVEIQNPFGLTRTELKTLHSTVRKYNMAVYVSGSSSEDKTIPLALGKQLGLHRLDNNWLAEEDGFSSISVHETPTGESYIPYTDKAIRWHTDGYYNPPERQIQGMLLHCVRPAMEGGHNELMDHELAYLSLRDLCPDFVQALSLPNAMTIPERVDPQGGIRPAQSGPVFSLTTAGFLHMRYTARTRSILWKQDDGVMQARTALENLLESDSKPAFSIRLESGMGLICNNVLHNRSAFRDSPESTRLIFRARYLDRVAQG